MFEATFSTAAVFKKLIEGLLATIEDVNFECSEFGINVYAISPSQTSMVIMSLESDGLEHFRCDRAMVMGMKLSSLAKFLRCVTNEHTITMRAQDQPDVAELIVESDKTKRRSQFEIPLMILNQDTFSIPDRDVNCVLTMSSKEWAKYMTNMHSFGETMYIEFNKRNQVLFSSTGNLGKAEVTLEEEEDDEHPEKDVNISIKTPLKMLFSCQYLLTFSKAAVVSDRVTLSMTENEPIIIELDIPQVGQMKFYLAAKFPDAVDDSDD